MSCLTEWQIREIDFSDIGPTDLGALTARYRCERPTLLVYNFTQLPWVGVAKCAPLDHMLWATELDGSGQYACERAWVEPLIDDRDTYFRFRQELKSAGIGSNEVPWSLLGPYCRWGAYLGKRSYSFQPGDVGEFRFSGVVVPADFKESLIAFCSRQLTQFDSFAFWQAPEGEEYRPRSVHSRMDSGGAVWRHPSRSPCLDESVRESLIAAQCERLGRFIDEIEAGMPLRLPWHFQDVIRPDPSFYAFRSRSGTSPVLGVSAASASELTELDAKLHFCRARVVRLLGWPNLYRTLYGIPDFWAGIRALKGETPSDSDLHRMANELLCFKSEMEQQYPVLLENPLAGLVGANTTN